MANFQIANIRPFFIKHENTPIEIKPIEIKPANLSYIMFSPGVKLSDVKTAKSKFKHVLISNNLLNFDFEQNPGVYYLSSDKSLHVTDLNYLIRKQIVKNDASVCCVLL